MFQPIDIGILVVFTLVTLIAGVWMTKRASQSMESYFLAGREMPWYLLGIAGMCNWFDLTGTMIITSFLFMLGPRGEYIEFRGGVCIGLAFLLVYAGKWHRRSGCMTYAEWMIFRFGENLSAELFRLATALINIALTVGMIAYLIRGTSLFFSVITPYPPMLITAVVIGFCTLYTMLAGFYGVIITDLIQGVKIVISCAVVSVMAFNMIGDTTQLADIAEKFTGNSQWLQSSLVWQVSMPKGYEAYESLFIFAAIYFLRNFMSGMSGGAESRYFAAKSDRDCGLQSLLQDIVIAFRWPLMMSIAVLGLYLVNNFFPDMASIQLSASMIRHAFPHIEQAYWHDLTSKIAEHPGQFAPELISNLKTTLGAHWRTCLSLVSFNGTVDPENIFPAVLLYTIPTGIRGLLLAAMISAMMSCLAGTLNGTVAMFTNDIYKNFFRKCASNRELIAASWCGTIAIVLFSFWMGVGAKNINDLWAWIIMGLGAGTIGPGVLRLYWWRINAWGCCAGQVCGGAGAIVQRIFNPGMPELHQFVLMTALSFGATIIVSLLTAPTDRATLTNFYLRTKPFGFWKPLFQALPTNLQQEFRAEHRTDIIAVPFALLAQITLFMLSMQIVIHQFASMLPTGILFLIGAVGLYKYWWLPLKRL